MTDDALDIDQSHARRKAQTLQSITAGSFSSAVAKLSGSSRCLPSDKDFHFYYNFEEFKNPIQEIAGKSHSMLETIGSSAHIWGKEVSYPKDIDDAYDWLVNVNDDVFERFDMSLDEFQRIRKKEEEIGRPLSSLEDESENPFQLVTGKKKKGAGHSGKGKDGGRDTCPASAVKVATKDNKTTGAKPKVPFHIPSIRRPQDEFNILVNNSNRPFEHVWLQRSEDGQIFVHPLENLSVLDFVDKDIGSIKPIKPPSLECTSFKLVEEVKDLKELAAKLRGVNEFAVDLEHNQYRSFQGLTCLMQISTRTEDFVVDTLKLRIHVGPYLREVFKDPTKKKVMHGADRDILWLQRDFGIYVCNLFDTGQASRVLKLERNSLEYLLHHYCGCTANKEYQNADWRLRPLPSEMIRYAREDTHYLLYVYDLMRIELSSLSVEAENSDALLVEVYKRSYEVCMQLYEKELLTENSYLYVYGLQGAGFSAHQLAVVAGLCEWRDVVARSEDESTGYVLPNKTLLEIAKQMPVTTSRLRRMVKSKHPYVERNLDSIVSIIRLSMQNATAYEAASEQLKEARVVNNSEDMPVANGIEASTPDTATLKDANVSKISSAAVQVKGESLVAGHSSSHSSDHDHKNEFPRAKDTGATVQVLKKPSGAFGALLGKSSAKRKLDSGGKGKEEEMKLEQIRSSSKLTFQLFSPGSDEQSKLVAEARPAMASETSHREEPEPEQAVTSNVDEIIIIDDKDDLEEPTQGNLNDRAKEPRQDLFDTEDKDDPPMSLSDLSSSFQECFQSLNENRKARQVKKTEESSGAVKYKPFDYAAAKMDIRFGPDVEEESTVGSDDDDLGSRRGGKKKGSATVHGEIGAITNEIPQGRRRQVFPASGNRSATFR